MTHRTYKQCHFVNKISLLGIACLCAAIMATAQAVKEEAALSGQQAYHPFVLDTGTINALPATYALQTPGIGEFGPQGKLNAKQFWLTRFTGDSKIRWKVYAATAADYQVDFLVNSRVGTRIQVSSHTGNTCTVTIAAKGWQRTRAGQALHLPAGNSILTLQLVSPVDTIDIKSIELVPLAAIQRIQQRIQAFKGDATWMKNAGYGIMTQVGGWAYPPKGNKKPWPGFAEAFDVPAFVEKVREMGGRYIVWSATWCDYLFPAPIQAIAEVLPQNVSRRDLIGELITECHRYGIRVMLYYHLGHDHQNVLLAKGWKNAATQDTAARQTWLNREMKIFKEIGHRYGKGLDAIFLDDGCVWYPANFEQLGAALKAGNPQRLICYNPWVGPSLTPFQDFYCGEGFDGSETPYHLHHGLITDGPQQGLQLFGNFVFDGPDWGIHQPNLVVQPPRGWTADKIVRMTRRLQQEQYSVAINVLMYEDGSMGPESYWMLREAARKLKRGKWSGAAAQAGTAPLVSGK